MSNRTPPITEGELRGLRLFLAVARHQGFAAAQSELNLSLSSISAQMAKLEARLGVRLCERGRAGFRLTPEGQRVLELGQSLFRVLEDFRSEVDLLRDRLSGHLRIGVVDNVANNPRSTLPSAVARFEGRSPAVEVAVEVVGPSELERRVADGRVNLGLGPALHNLQGLTYTPVFEELQLLYCSGDHPLFGVRPSRLTDAAIARARHVAHVCPIPEAWGPAIEPATTAQHMESVALLVLSGRYVGFLPAHYAAEWEARGQMRALWPERYRYSNTFYAIVRRQVGQPELLRAFLEDLLDTAPAGACAGRPRVDA